MWRELGQCWKPSGLLKGAVLKSPVTGFALCLLDDLNESHKTAS